MKLLFYVSECWVSSPGWSITGKEIVMRFCWDFDDVSHVLCQYLVLFTIAKTNVLKSLLINFASVLFYINLSSHRPRWQGYLRTRSPETLYAIGIISGWEKKWRILWRILWTLSGFDRRFTITYKLLLALLDVHSIVCPGGERNILSRLRE